MMEDTRTMILLESAVLMDNLSNILRELMASRGLQGTDLAAMVGISPNSLSAILTGKSKPRALTFHKLKSRLASNREERLKLEQAYTGAAADESLESPPMERPAPPTIVLEPSTSSFLDDIDVLLKRERIPVIRDFEFDDLSTKIRCDFVTKSGKNRIVIEAKYNLNENWDHTLGTCLMVKRKLPARAVVVVVPYHNVQSLDAAKYFVQDHIPIVPITELASTLRAMGA